MARGFLRLFWIFLALLILKNNLRAEEGRFREILFTTITFSMRPEKLSTIPPAQSLAY
jgi:hypothetical protein